MSKVWLYTCTGTRGEATAIGGAEYGTCTPVASGAWVEIEYQPPDGGEHWFNYPVDAQSFADLLGVVIAMFCIAWGIKMVGNVFRGKR